MTHSFDVPVCIEHEDKPETVTAECDEAFDGAELALVEVWRYTPERGVYDCYDDLDHITREYIADRCNLQMARRVFA